jgi:hypothetical protein
MEIYTLYQHWEKENYLFDIVGPVSRYGGEDYNVIQLYENLGNNKLKRIRKVKELVENIEAAVDSMGGQVFNNPVIQY